MSGISEKIGANGIFALYMVLVVLLVLVVNHLSKHSRSRDGNDSFLVLLDWFETRGFGTFFHILVLGGTLLLALIGWRIPSEIERLYGAGASFGLIFPKVDISMMGRAAQVVGAFGLGFVALRAMRFFIPIFTILVFVVLVALSISYVFGFDIHSMVYN